MNKYVVKGIVAFTTVVGLLVVWLFFENSNSYIKPEEALLAIEEDLILIPAYKIDDESLLFFIKDHEHLGASYIHKGLLGWKAGHLAWSPLDRNVGDNQLNGYQGYGDNLIYGLMTNGDEQIVTMNNDVAYMLNLEMLPAQIVDEYQLNGLYLWYIKSDRGMDEGEIKLVNKYSNEVIDLILK